MDVGRLNKRITFMIYEEKIDELEQTKQCLVKYKKLWASVEPISSKEILDADKYSGEITHRIYLRFREDITTDMFIEFKKRKFEISAPPINVKEENSLTMLLCKEIEGDKFE